MLSFSEDMHEKHAGELLLRKIGEEGRELQIVSLMVFVSRKETSVVKKKARNQ